MPPQSSLTKTEGVLFCVLAGVIATFSTGYNFGNENQHCHFPIALRVMDPDYLPNDFFVNSNDAEVGPRFYYVRVLAFFTQFLPLHYVILALTIVSKSLLALVTFYVAGRMHRGSSLASIFAVAFVLSVKSFMIGYASRLAEQQMEPALLVRAISLLSLWMALQGRLFLCTVLAMIAIPFHVLVGLESAGIGLIAYTIFVLFEPLNSEQGWRVKFRKLAGIALSSAVLLGFVHLVLGRFMERSLSASQFIHIMCEIRSPHHYLPSTFLLRDYLLGGCFFFAMWIVWFLWKRDAEDQDAPPKIFLVNVVVLFLLLAGYLFVEVFPSREFASAQTFRTLFVTKWFGFLLFAGIAANAINRKQGSASGWLFLLGSGPFQPVIVMLAAIVEAIQDRVRARFGGRTLKLIFGLVLIQIGSFIADSPWQELQSVMLLVLLGLWFFNTPKKSVWHWAPVLVVPSIAWALIAGIHVPRIPDPQITLQQLNAPIRDLAEVAKEKTPTDALFIVPPTPTDFRLLTNRAILVEWKAYPFGDSAMLEWYQRMGDCYALPGWKDVPQLPVMRDNYRNISDDHLRSIGRKYNCNYAILYASTPTKLETLFKDANYRLVKLGLNSNTDSEAP